MRTTTTDGRTGRLVTERFMFSSPASVCVCVFVFFFFVRIGGLIIFLLVWILLHTKTHVQKTTPNGGVGGVGWWSETFDTVG